MDIAISVKNLSKKYRLFNSPEERFKEALHPFKKKYHREFWALKDVTFDVPKGATVGIIGRNGSGKSTLLQIICGILKPTSGEVTVNGRISALLELGAGFNPELTGRQNVVLNGIVQGFSKDEMNAKIPQIQEFADIGEFFDQPVKIYSSGMFVRLAFAAAINVDPDILIVDEALAVGDAKFQHKCYQKFLEFQEAGKTILFVTHDMNAIVKHCDHAFLLEKGGIIEGGKPISVCNRYLDIIEGRQVPKNNTIKLSTASQQKFDNTFLKPYQSELEKFLEDVPVRDNCPYRNSYNKNEYRQGNNLGEIVDYFVVCGDKYDPVAVYSGDVVDIYIKAKFHQPVESPVTGFSIKTVDGVQILGFNNCYNKTFIQPIKDSEIVVFKFSIKMNLQSADYFIDLGIAEKINEDDYYEAFDRRCAIIHLNVQRSNFFGGLVYLETTFQEILRKNDKINNYKE